MIEERFIAIPHSLDIVSRTPAHKAHVLDPCILLLLLLVFLPLLYEDDADDEA